jgi:alpha-ribazole phosphatase
MKVYIIRHTSVDVPKGVCYGQTDVPLRETFQDEARQVADNIKDLKFDKVFCSPLSR